MSGEKTPAILGYRRSDGTAGIRNSVAILYTTACSLAVAERLFTLFPAGTLLFGLPDGCRYDEAPVERIERLCENPNIFGALVVGLGCEGTDASELAARLGSGGKPVEFVRINEAGGDLRALETGSRLLARLLQDASAVERAPLDVSDLIVCGKCGGSDATSGLAANPVLGFAADLLIDAGGTYIHDEIGELMGCGDILAARAEDEAVGREIREAIRAEEEACFASGRFSWSFGNIQGGLTSIEEKSYGALAKSGSKPLRGILHGFERPRKKGYHIQVQKPQASPFHACAEVVNQMAACGAHLGVITTGCGSTVGGLIPVIKVISNPTREQLIRDNADIDASSIIEGRRTIEEVGLELYREILSVASGKLTRAEVFRHFEG